MESGERDLDQQTCKGKRLGAALQCAQYARGDPQWGRMRTGRTAEMRAGVRSKGGHRDTGWRLVQQARCMRAVASTRWCSWVVGRGQSLSIDSIIFYKF